MVSRRTRFESLEDRRLLAGLDQWTFGELVAAEDSVYFWHRTPETGRELYRSSSQTPFKQLVHDIAPGPEDSWVEDLHVVGDEVVFVAEQGTTLRQLWVTDGTDAGLRLLREFTSSDELRRSVSIEGVTQSAVVYSVWERDSEGVRNEELFIQPLTGGEAISIVRQTGIDSTYLILQDEFLLYVERTASDNRVWVSDGTAEGTRLLNELTDLFDGDPFVTRTRPESFNDGVWLSLQATSPSRDRHTIVRYESGRYELVSMTNYFPTGWFAPVVEAGAADLFVDGFEHSYWKVENDGTPTRFLSRSQLDDIGDTTDQDSFRAFEGDYYFTTETYFPYSRHLYRRDRASGAIELVDEAPLLQYSPLLQAGKWLVYQAASQAEPSFVVVDMEARLTQVITTPLHSTASFTLEALTPNGMLAFRATAIDETLVRIIDLNLSPEQDRSIIEWRRSNPESDLISITPEAYGNLMLVEVQRQNSRDLIRLEKDAGAPSLVVSNSVRAGLIPGTLRTYSDVRGLGESGFFASTPGIGQTRIHDSFSKDFHLLDSFEESVVSQNAAWLVVDHRVVRYHPERQTRVEFDLSSDDIVPTEDGVIVREGRRILRLYENSDSIEVVTEDITSAPIGVSEISATGSQFPSRLIYANGEDFYATDGTSEGTVKIDSEDTVRERAAAEIGGVASDFFFYFHRTSNGALTAHVAQVRGVQQQVVHLYVERPGAQGLQRVPIEPLPRSQFSRIIPTRVADRWFVATSNNDGDVWVDGQEQAVNAPYLLNSSRQAYDPALVFAQSTEWNGFQVRDVFVGQRGESDMRSFLEAIGINSETADADWRAGWVGLDGTVPLLSVYQSGSSASPQIRVYAWDDITQPPREIPGLSVAFTENYLLRVSANRYHYVGWNLQPILIPKSELEFELPERLTDAVVTQTQVELAKQDSEPETLDRVAGQRLTLKSSVASTDFHLHLENSTWAPGSEIAIELDADTNVRVTTRELVNLMEVVSTPESVIVIVDGQTLEFRGSALDLHLEVASENNSVTLKKASVASVQTESGRVLVRSSSGDSMLQTLQFLPGKLTIHTDESLQRLSVAGNGEIESQIDLRPRMDANVAIDFEYPEEYTVVASENRFGRTISTLKRGDLILSIDHSVAPRQNPIDRFDTNGDTLVSLLDAVLVINQLERSNVGSGVAGESLIDVNGDQQITPIDALQIINHLGSPEAEGENATTPMKSFVQDSAVTDLFGDRDESQETVQYLF
ncbi:MAG: dockerin type I domain-containing protein [Planctomycetota bacterium]